MARTSEAKLRYQRDYFRRNRDKINAQRREYRKTHADVIRRCDHRSNYGLAAEEYDRLQSRQDGACAICGTTEFPSRGNCLHVDHNHLSGSVRGLLCSHCNIGLGKFFDRPELLEVAAAYLREAAHEGRNCNA